MEIFSAASILAIAGKLVTAEVTKAAISGAKSQLQPDKMALVLKQANELAQATQPETGGIFFRCQSKAAEGFLAQFFQSIEVLKELQKPLQDDGKPDVAVLVMAFDRSAQQYVGMQDYIPDTLHSWIETFVDSYFDQLQGIYFQVAKKQYLKQLARRVDDVKFVGIAVAGEEVEKQEVLAQIFVMPDVREEKIRNSRQLLTPIEEHLNEVRRQMMEGDMFDGNQLIGKNFEPNTNGSATVQKLTKQSLLLKEQKEWETRDRSAPRITAQKVINLSQKKAVVLGAPGSGKTMLASYFALMLCETAQSDRTQIGLEKDADYLPVVVQIRDWILQPNMGLLEYLRSNAEASLACKELPAGFFEHWLDRGRALILLDGVDEVVDEAQRSKIAEKIVSFLHQYKDNPAVITSRPAGYKGLFKSDEFPHYTLESFDDKQVATFIDHWYDSRLGHDKEKAQRRKADLQSAFAKNERIRLLAKNPLLLTIITLIHRYQAELPRQRCKLYEKAVETLLTSWDSGKEIKLYDQVLQHLKSDDLLYILKKLAYWIHTQGSTGETEGGTLIDKDELLRQLQREIKMLKKCEPHEAKGEAERFIDFIQRRTGLLNEQGRDRYAFVHKTFQEYLTAEEIFDRADVEDDTDIILSYFRSRLHDQHWREVLLLLVSKLKGKKAQKAIQTVLDAESKYEHWLQRDLLFAGWCLTEDPPELMMVAGDFVGEILDRLVSLEVCNSERIGSKVSIEVEKTLHCFGETTLETTVLEKLEMNGHRIEQFQLLEFQASLGKESIVIDTLLSLLKSKDPILCLCAASSLGRLGNTSEKIFGGLLSLLGHGDLILRICAIEALNRLGHKSEEVISSLVLMVNNDNDLHISSDAARLLGRLGNPREDVIDSLLFLLNYEVSDVRPSAVEALIQLGSNNTEVISRLLPLLNDEDLLVRASAAESLGFLDVGNMTVVDCLLSLIENPDWNVRNCAVLVLDRLGHLSDEVVNHLLFLLEDPDWNVRNYSALVLGQLGRFSDEVVNHLLSLLKDKNWNICHDAASALSHLMNPSDEVLNCLLSLLSEDNQAVCVLAVSILGKLKSTNSVISGLLSLLGNQHPGVRFHVAEALVQLAKTSDVILPEVVQWLAQNPHDDEIGGEIDCLWSIVVE